MSSPRTALATVVLLALGSTLAHAHCQIPCGIYGDETRFALLNEHVATIEKSMKQIDELSNDTKANANQITRWVINKEDHATTFAEIVTYYFLAQRIKAPKADDAQGRKVYLRELELIHGMVVGAMKCKQSTDVGQAEALRGLVHDFEVLYTGSHDHKH